MNFRHTKSRLEINQSTSARLVDRCCKTRDGLASRQTDLFHFLNKLRRVKCFMMALPFISDAPYISNTAHDSALMMDHRIASIINLLRLYNNPL